MFAEIAFLMNGLLRLRFTAARNDGFKLVQQRCKAFRNRSLNLFQWRFALFQNIHRCWIEFSMTGFSSDSFHAFAGILSPRISENFYRLQQKYQKNRPETKNLRPPTKNPSGFILKKIRLELERTNDLTAARLRSKSTQELVEFFNHLAKQSFKRFHKFLLLRLEAH